MNLKQSIRRILKEESHIDDEQLFLNQCKKTDAYNYFVNRFKLDTVDDDEAIVDTEYGYEYRMDNRSLRSTVSDITEEIKYNTENPKSISQLTRIYNRFCKSLLSECGADEQTKTHRVLYLMVRKTLLEMRTHD
jgi:hypothetical protein